MDDLTVRGYGKTVEEAKQDAASKARELVGPKYDVFTNLSDDWRNSAWRLTSASCDENPLPSGGVIALCVFKYGIGIGPIPIQEPIY